MIKFVFFENYLPNNSNFTSYNGELFGQGFLNNVYAKKVSIYSQFKCRVGSARYVEPPHEQDFNNYFGISDSFVYVIMPEIIGNFDRAFPTLYDQYELLRKNHD